MIRKYTDMCLIKPIIPTFEEGFLVVNALAYPERKSRHTNMDKMMINLSSFSDITEWIYCNIIIKTLPLFYCGGIQIVEIPPAPVPEYAIVFSMQY